jgi:hypothetical protein
MVLLGIRSDTQRLSRTTRRSVSGLLRQGGRHDFVLEVNQPVTVDLEDLRTELRTDSVPAAALAVREGSQRGTLRSSIQLSHSRPLNRL